ncbi:MAG: tetratricopeptide repeat protein [Candidatus Rifleibacteriota bacterium]
MNKTYENIYRIVFILAVWAFCLSPCYSIDKDAQYDIKLEKARLAFSMKRWQELEQAAADLITVRANSAEGQFLLGVAEFYQGKNDQALQRFNWLCNQNPSDAAYRFFLGRALLAKGLKKDARVQIEYAVKLKPGNKKYSNFYKKLTALEVPEEQKKSRSKEKTEKHVQSAKFAQTSVIDKRITDLLKKLENNPDKAVKQVFAALKAEPELISLEGWNKKILVRFNKEIKNFKNELIRRYLLWKSDLIKTKEFSFYLMDSRINAYKSGGDEAVKFILGQAQKAGLETYEKQTSEDLVVPWFETLNKRSRAAFLDVRLEDAWNEHINKRDSESSLWNYQTARLALELWQLQGFENHWLETAQKHLLYCRESNFKIEESNILLANISTYIGEPTAK